MGRRAREGFPCSSRRTFAVDPRYIQEVVACPSDEEPEAVVVDTGNRYLYHVRAGGMATRYGAAVGRSGFEWSGRAKIAYKREWPVWTPPT